MKLLIKLVLFAAVLLGLLGLAGWFLVPPAAKGAVEQGSRYAFGVPTTLAKLDASLGFGTSGLALEGYSVQSPAGFEGKPLLAIQTLGFGVGTRSLFGEPKVIDEVLLEGLELNLVQKGTANNLWPVLQQVRRMAGGGGEPAPDADGKPANPGPRIQVRRVRIAGLAANFELSGVPGLDTLSKRFELPAYDADWTQLSGPEGLTVAEFTGKLMEQVTDSALKESEKHLPQSAVQLVRATLEGGLEGGLGGALDAAEGAAQKELQQLEERARDKAKELLEKGTGELERGKDKLEEQAQDLIGEEAAAAIGSGLDSAVGGVLGDQSGAGVTGSVEGAKEQVAGGVEKAVEQAPEKAASEVDKAADKAGKAVEGVLPDAKKKLFGGLKGGGGGGG